MAVTIFKHQQGAKRQFQKYKNERENEKKRRDMEIVRI